MPFPQTFFQPKFMPAHLVQDSANGIRVAFATTDGNGKLKHQYIKLNKAQKMLSESDFAAYVENTINEINAKLLTTYSTVARRDERQGTPILEALSRFIAEKGRELRPATMRSYGSFCRVFGQWFTKKYGNIAVGDVTKLQAVTYLEYYYNERQVGNNCYNNQMKLARGVFSWLVQHCYLDINPFENIAPKIKEQKKRGLIDKDIRDQITEYLEARQEWGMLLVCHLVYSALIRPKEISMLAIKDVNISGHYITLPPDITKTRHERVAALTPQIIDLLVNRLRIQLYPPHYYLLGSTWLPSRTQCNTQLFSKRFIRLRRELQLPDTMQLYSFRDSGITDLLRQGVDTITVMQHADHHSLDITTRYANHVDAHRVEKLYNRLEGF